jgi:glutathione S-transferase
MKLYFMPGACSLSPHICLREAGADFTTERVGRDKKLPSGGSYLDKNPLGYVPAIELDDGTVLTEGPAIVQWIADQHPSSGLAPANGTIERAKFQSVLNFISTELHKGFSPLFYPNPDEVKASFRTLLQSRIAHIAPRLADGGYAFGTTFTAADAYLFTVLSWSPMVGVELPDVVTAYLARIATRPAVAAARAAEGLK